MSLWYCDCHGYHGPQAICRAAFRQAIIGRDTVAESPAPVSEIAAKHSPTAPASRHESGVPQDDSQ